MSTTFALHVPDELVDAIACRVVELLDARQPAAPPAGGYLDVTQAAAYIAAEPHRIYDLVRQGRVRHHRDGRRLLFKADDLDAALDAVDQTLPIDRPGNRRTNAPTGDNNPAAASRPAAGRRHHTTTGD